MPKHVPKHWNQCFPILEPRIPSFRNLAAPTHWNRSFPILEPRVQNSRNLRILNIRTDASQSWNRGFPILDSRNWRFQNIGTDASQSWYHGFPILGTRGSQKLEPMLPEHWFRVRGTDGSKRWNPCFPIFEPEELLVPKGSNQCFPILDPVLGTGSSHWFQVLGTTVFQTFEPMPSNLGTVCLQFQELLVPKIGINASDARNCKFPVLGISDSETLERML